MVVKGSLRAVFSLTIFHTAMVQGCWFKTTPSILSFFFHIFGVTISLLLRSMIRPWFFPFIISSFPSGVTREVNSGISMILDVYLLGHVILYVWRWTVKGLWLGNGLEVYKGHPVPIITIEHCTLTDIIINPTLEKALNSNSIFLEGSLIMYLP